MINVRTLRQRSPVRRQIYGSFATMLAGLLIMGLSPSSASAHAAPPSVVFSNVSSWNGVTFHEPHLQWVRGPNWENAFWDGSHTKCTNPSLQAHMDKRVGFIDSDGNTVWEPFIHSEAGYWNCEDTATYHEGWTMDGFPTSIDAVGIHWQVFIGGALIAEAKTTVEFDPPAAPTDLRVADVTPSAVSLAWTDNSSNETAFELQRSEDDRASWATIVRPSANETAHTDDSLIAGRSYSYRIRALNANGNSAWSNVLILDRVPAPPTDLHVASVTSSSISLEWSDASTNESAVQLKRSSDGGVSWADLSSLGANTTSYTDSDLPSGSTFYYRVRATNGTGACQTGRMSRSAQRQGRGPRRFARMWPWATPIPPVRDCGRTSPTQ